MMRATQKQKEALLLLAEKTTVDGEFLRPRDIGVPWRTLDSLYMWLGWSSRNSVTSPMRFRISNAGLRVKDKLSDLPCKRCGSIEQEHTMRALWPGCLVCGYCYDVVRNDIRQEMLERNDA